MQDAYYMQKFLRARVAEDLAAHPPHPLGGCALHDDCRRFRLEAEAKEQIAKVDPEDTADPSWHIEVLRRLAAVYDIHDDYKDEWAL